MTDYITKELAETLKELRELIDNEKKLGIWSPIMARVDAVLDRYEDACKTPEEPMYPKQPKPINMVEIESQRWATALTGFIDKLGGDSAALWEWEGKTPTPEKVVECLQELFDFHMQISADEELEACVEWFRQNNFRLDVLTTFRDARRPKPTLKSQALKDFEMVRKHSDLLPEILETIENALKSIPE